MRKIIPIMLATLCTINTCNVVSAYEESEEDKYVLFYNLSQQQFWFSSGAGAWGTNLSIDEYGNFTGHYSDSEMGSTGEGYPNGTMYECYFSGVFDNPVMINEYSYSLDVVDIMYENEIDTSEIIDETLHYYTEPYGLCQAEQVIVYLPGTPLTELPEEYLSWTQFYDLSDTTEIVLPNFGIYNSEEGTGFNSYLSNSDPESLVNFATLKAKTIETYIDNQPVDQHTANQLSYEVYMTWDNVLNELWAILKETLDSSAMEALTNEEIDWISMKEAEIEKAGAEFEGGSLQAFIMNTKGAELTENRVWELLDIYYIYAE